MRSWMRAARRLAMSVGAVCLARTEAVAAQAPQADSWHDAAPHKVGYVNVTPTVRLHYLDFGGTGAPIVFLAGLGNTAHAFDDFAPRFTDRFHVLALTRRGFGESSHPSDGYDTERLVEDVRQFLDRLKLSRVILIGHSIAGEELSRFAARYPDRVSKLVYLDAAYDRVAFDSMLVVNMPVPLPLPTPPQPAAADSATAAGYVQFVHRTRGLNIPEADIRARYRADGWREEAGFAYQAMAAERPPYRDIRAPALAIYAVTTDVSQLEPWQRADREHVDGLREMIAIDEGIAKRLRAQFRREVAHSGVVELRGAHHWIFVSNAGEVENAIRRFLAVP